MSSNRIKVDAIPTDSELQQEINNGKFHVVPTNLGLMGGAQDLFYFHPEIKVAPHFVCSLCGALIRTYSGVYKHKKYCRVLKEQESTKVIVANENMVAKNNGRDESGTGKPGAVGDRNKDEPNKTGEAVELQLGEEVGGDLDEKKRSGESGDLDEGKRSGKSGDLDEVKRSGKSGNLGKSDGVCKPMDKPNKTQNMMEEQNDLVLEVGGDLEGEKKRGKHVDSDDSEEDSEDSDLSERGKSAARKRNRKKRKKQKQRANSPASRTHAEKKH